MSKLLSRMIVHHSDDGIFAMRRGKCKLMLDNKGGSGRGNKELKTNPIINNADMLLFDMEKDRVESTNLSGQYPEVVESLKKELAEIIQKGRSTPGAPQRNDPLPVNEKWTQIDPVRKYMN